MSIRLMKYALNCQSVYSFSTNSRVVVARNFSSSQWCSRKRFSGDRNKAKVPALPEIKFGGRIVYRRTAEEVEGAAMELRNFVESKKSKEGHCILGLDIEWRPTFRKGFPQGKAAVMQICGENSCCYAFHIFHSQIPTTLKDLLEDPASVKVGVGIASDANKVLRDHNAPIKNLLDLSHLANQKLGGERRSWSLSSLTESFICKFLPKPNYVKLGNWEVEVLSKEQLTYAVNDAYVSWYLYQVLNNIEDPANNERVEILKNVNDDSATLFEKAVA